MPGGRGLPPRRLCVVVDVHDASGDKAEPFAGAVTALQRTSEEIAASWQIGRLPAIDDQAVADVNGALHGLV